MFSFISVFEIAFTAAVFPVRIAIGLEPEPTAGAGVIVNGLFLHLIYMAVPPQISALVGAEPLVLSAHLLFHGSSAVFAEAFFLFSGSMSYFFSRNDPVSGAVCLDYNLPNQ